MADTTQRSLLLRAAFFRLGLPRREVWISSLALGGNSDELEFDGFLHSIMSLPERELDVLAHVVNERLDELDEPDRHPRVPYSWTPADRGA